MRGVFFLAKIEFCFFMRRNLIMCNNLHIWHYHKLNNSITNNKVFNASTYIYYNPLRLNSIQVILLSLTQYTVLQPVLKYFTIFRNSQSSLINLQFSKFDNLALSGIFFFIRVILYLLISFLIFQYILYVFLPVLYTYFAKLYFIWVFFISLYNYVWLFIYSFIFISCYCLIWFPTYLFILIMRYCNNILSIVLFMLICVIYFIWNKLFFFHLINIYKKIIFFCSFFIGGFFMFIKLFETNSLINRNFLLSSIWVNNYFKICINSIIAKLPLTFFFLRPQYNPRQVVNINSNMYLYAFINFNLSNNTSNILNTYYALYKLVLMNYALTVGSAAVSCSYWYINSCVPLHSNRNNRYFFNLRYDELALFFGNRFFQKNNYTIRGLKEVGVFLFNLDFINNYQFTSQLTSYTQNIRSLSYIYNKIQNNSKLSISFLKLNYNLASIATTSYLTYPSISTVVSYLTYYNFRQFSFMYNRNYSMVKLAEVDLVNSKLLYCYNKFFQVHLIDNLLQYGINGQFNNLECTVYTNIMWWPLYKNNIQHYGEFFNF